MARISKSLALTISRVKAMTIEDYVDGPYRVESSSGYQIDFSKKTLKIGCRRIATRLGKEVDLKKN